MTDTKAPERTYTKNGKTFPIGYPDKSDTEMAGIVRMLARHDLRHEIVCTAARDRILCIAEERDHALSLVAAALRENCVNCCGTGKDARGYDCDCGTPDDALAALEARDKEVREEALREATTLEIIEELKRRPSNPPDTGQEKRSLIEGETDE